MNKLLFPLYSKQVTLFCQQIKYVNHIVTACCHRTAWLKVFIKLQKKLHYDLLHVQNEDSTKSGRLPMLLKTAYQEVVSLLDPSGLNVEAVSLSLSD